jgi:hypothetical protein
VETSPKRDFAEEVQQVLRKLLRSIFGLFSAHWEMMFCNATTIEQHMLSEGQKLFNSVDVIFGSRRLLSLVSGMMFPEPFQGTTTVACTGDGDRSFFDIF